MDSVRDIRSLRSSSRLAGCARGAAILGLLFTFIFCGAESYADSSCSATNSNGDQSCSVSCPTGQSASCSQASGSSTPSCSCSGSSDVDSLMKGFKRNTVRAAISKSGAALKLSAHVAAPLAPPSVEETNVIEVINTKLAQLGDKHLADSCTTVTPACPLRHCPPNSEDYCDPYDRPCPPSHEVCTPVIGKLTVATPLTVIKGPSVELGNINWSDIPTDVFAGHAHFANCTTTEQSDQVSYQVTTVSGVTITKTKALETGRTETTNINGKVSFGGVEIGGSDSITVSTKTSYTDANSENHSTQQQIQIQKPIKYPAGTVVDATYQSIRYDVPIPFSGTVVVDAALNPNLTGNNSLSTVMPSEQDRTFQFAGFVTDASLIDDASQIQQRKPTPQECPSTQ
jgi:hypothetical protein